MDLYSAIQYLLFVAIVTVLVKPFGGYMERVFSRKRTVLDHLCLPVERLIYRITAVSRNAKNAKTEQRIGLAQRLAADRSLFRAASLDRSTMGRIQECQWKNEGATFTPRVKN